MIYKLEAMYPGRIGLGIGRAPGTDSLTALALRRSRGAFTADDFLSQLAELIAWEMGRFHPIIRSVPSGQCLTAGPCLLSFQSGYTALEREGRTPMREIPDTRLHSIPNHRVAAVVAAALLALAAFAETPANGFHTIGPMSEARVSAAAVLLPDGTALIVGGKDAGNSNLRSGEVYDPAQQFFHTLTSAMSVERASPNAVLLRNGRVLLLGGLGPMTSEIYDPVTKTFGSVAPMDSEHPDAAAILLADGRVLVAGGQLIEGFIATAEIYDPSSNSWQTTGPLITARGYQASVLLPDGRVLVAGGYNDSGALASAEIYDPLTGQFTATGALSSPGIPIGFRLPDGRAAMVGVETIDLYDPDRGTFNPSAALVDDLVNESIVELPNGVLFITGGQLDSGDSAEALVCDVEEGAVTTVATMQVPRHEHVSLLMPDGTILVAGGRNATASALASAEVYVPPGPRERIARH